MAGAHLGHSPLGHPMVTSRPSCQDLALCWASPGHTQVRRCLCLGPSSRETWVGGCHQAWGSHSSTKSRPKTVMPADQAQGRRQRPWLSESEAEKVLFGFFVCMGASSKKTRGLREDALAHGPPVGPEGYARAGVFIQMLPCIYLQTSLGDTKLAYTLK